MASMIAALILFSVAAVPKLIAGLAAGAGKFAGIFNKKNFTGLKSTISDSFTKGKEGIFGGGKNKSETDDIASTGKNSKSGDGLKSLSDGLKKMGRKGITKGIANTALAGLALPVLLLGIPTLLLMAGVGAMGDLIVKGFSSIAKGFQKIGNPKAMKNILMGSLAMAAIGISIIPFAFAMQMFGGVDWGSALTGVGILALIMVGLGVVGSTMAWVFPLIMIGAGLMAAVGVVLIPVAYAMGLLGESMQKFTNVNWGGLEEAGNVLMALAPALMSFAIAGMFFANPLTLIGMVMMLGVLTGVGAIMAPLAESLGKGATALDSMGSSVEKLNDSLGKLDFDKLEKLKEISQEFANASGNGDALASALEKFATSMGGGKDGKGGGGGAKTLVVQLKMPNGRVIQEQIIDDINKVS